MMPEIQRTTAAIRPELLAGKLASVRRLEFPRFAARLQSEPRLAELLNFIQWQSAQPGGLPAFARTIADELPAQIGTPAMHSIGRPRGGHYSLTELGAIWRDLPDRVREEIFPVVGRLGGIFVLPDLDDYGEETPASKQRSAEAKSRFDYQLTLILDSPAPARELARYSIADQHEIQSEIREAISRLTPETLTQLCRDEFVAMLPARLVDLCEAPMDNFDAAAALWCFADLPGALLETMTRHAAKSAGRIARTRVAQQVFEALDYAVETGSAVMLRGDTGLGKSESVKAYVASRPGLVRVVRQPPGNSLPDMLARVAEAVGLSIPPSTTRRVLQDKVLFVLSHCRFFLVWDEFHHAIGDSFNRNSAPVRLNWVRDAVMDAGLPCAFITTPQDFQKRLRKFVKATSYNVDQFLRRVEFWPDLPAENEQQDLEAVAALHFPQFAASLRRFVASQVIKFGGGASGVESIAKLAGFFSRRAGRAQPVWDDVERAANQFKAGRHEQKVFAGLAQNEAPEAGRQRPGKPVARRSQTVCGSDFEAMRKPSAVPAQRGTKPMAESNRLMAAEPKTATLVPG